MFRYVRLEQQIQYEILDPMLFPHFCGHFQVLFTASIRSSWVEDRHRKQRQKGETTSDPTSYLTFGCVFAPLICVASVS